MAETEESEKESGVRRPQRQSSAVDTPAPPPPKPAVHYRCNACGAPHHYIEQVVS